MLTRRRFLKIGFGGTAMAGLLGCASAPTPATGPLPWQEAGGGNHAALDRAIAELAEEEG